MEIKLDRSRGLIVLLSLLTAAIVFFIFYNIKVIYDIKKETADQNLFSVQYKNELSMLNSIKQQGGNINSIIEQYKEKIPCEPKENEIINLINELTGEAELLGITFSARTEGDVAVIMPVKADIRSDYFTMIEILRRLPDTDRFFTVNNIDITAQTGSALTYSINLNAYYTIAAEPAETTAGTEPAETVN